MENTLYTRWRTCLLSDHNTLNSALEKAITKRSSILFSGKEKQEFTGETEFNAQLLVSLICTCGYYFERIQDILTHVNSFSEKTIKGQLQYSQITPIAFKICNALLSDDLFLTLLSKIFGTSRPDCKEISTVLFTAYLCLTRKAFDSPSIIKMALVTGIVFHQKYAPKGVGHNWVLVNDLIIDAAISSDGVPQIIKRPYDGYIPIVSVNTILSSHKMSFLREFTINSLWEPSYDLENLVKLMQ